MARAQDGDQAAYRQLLHLITGYLRSVVGRHQRNPADVEDMVQDILLTVHAIRHTYDPSRPFGPWLVAIAHRRIVDRLRRQGRLRRRETPLEPEHETFAAGDANLSEIAGDGRALRQAIGTLPEGQRQAIAALKVATHRAVKSLRKILGERDLT